MSTKQGRPGRPLLQRIPGDLMPVYTLLAELLPGQPASQGQKNLAGEIGKRLGKPALSVPNLLREMSGPPDRPQTIHPDYLAAFKQVYPLAALGITDDLLLSGDGPERDRVIRAIIERQGFFWLASHNQGPPARLDLIRPATGMPLADDRLGPNSGRFHHLPDSAGRQIPAGTEFQFSIDLPWPGHITLLSQDPGDIRYQVPDLPGRPLIRRPTFCLDGFAGILDRPGADGPWPAGRSVLPGILEMHPPFGLTQTLLLATPEPLPLPWPPDTTWELTAEQLAALVRAMTGRQFLVSCLDYHVIE